MDFVILFGGGLIMVIAGIVLDLECFTAVGTGLVWVGISFQG